MKSASVFRYIFVSAFFCLIIACTACAALKDDVLGLTGNVQAKMAWVRAKPSASDFDHIPSYLYNYGTETSLICYDSDEDAERILDAGPSQHACPLINRTGDYVIWNSFQDQKSYIINWDGQNKRTLVDGSCYYILCCQWDESSGKEYLYATTASGTANIRPEAAMYSDIYKMELVNGAVDAGAAQSLLPSWMDETYRAPMLVSGDGSLGAISNWPYIFVWNFAGDSGTSINVGEGLACWPSMGPDNSGRFWHFNDAHNSVHMFDVYNTTDASKIRYIEIASKMPGNTFPDATSPRYSNHIRYISASWPLNNFGENNSAVIAAGEFCIGKFNATYDDISFVRISQAGDNFRDRTGDLWIASGEGPGKDPSEARHLRTSPIEHSAAVSAMRGAISVSLSSPGAITAQLVNVQGQVIASQAGMGTLTWSISDDRIISGTYFIKVASGQASFTRKVLICE